MTTPDAKDLLDDLAASLENEALKTACMGVINHPKFSTAYGSAGEHHAYEGGLIIHTAEVVDFAYGMATVMFCHADVDVDAVITAAIFHDFMKIEEYERDVNSDGIPFGPIKKTKYRNLVRHVAGSHAEFMMAVAGKDVPEDTKLKIEHAMLAHHGRKEWGSPVEPQTVEAFILHNADMASVLYGPCSKRH